MTMKNETQIAFRAIEKTDKELEANTEHGNYYKGKEALKQVIADFVRGHDFAALTKKEILHLGYLVYKYCAMAPHTYLMKCGLQYGLLNS